MTLLLVVALPLSSAALLAIVGRRLGRRSAGAILTGGLALAFAAALAIGQAFAAGKTSLVAEVWTWLPLRGADLVLRIDPTTVPLLILFTGVATLVALSALGSLAREDDVARFGAAFAMTLSGTLLVLLAANLLLLFAGWEIVAAGTYLLVAHRRDRPAASVAAARAFVVARVGDAALLVAILSLLAQFRTVDIAEIAQHLTGFADQPEALARFGAALFVPSVLVLIAALARSAQVPFHAWLADATEAPVAATALIHTVVAAGGVVLLVRLAPFLHPGVLAAAAAIGALTAIGGAVVALAQTDARRLLAWSTASQLGLLFVAAGTGGAYAALFVLIAHALAKTTLLLAAGARGTRGGAVAFAVGALALAAVPPAAGFFGIAALAASVPDRPALLVAILGTVLLTGLYTARLLAAPRSADRSTTTSTLLALAPAVALALAALAFGGLVAGGAISLGVAAAHPAEPMLAASGAALALIGLAGGTALRRWPRRIGLPSRLEQSARSGFEIDALYRLAIVEPFRAAAHVLDRGTERVLQQSEDLVSAAVVGAGELASGAHRRYARASEAVVLASALALALYWALR